MRYNGAAPDADGVSALQCTLWGNYSKFQSKSQTKNSENFINKISGLKPGKTREIMIQTADYFTFLEPMAQEGKILIGVKFYAKIMIDGNEDLANDMRKDIVNSTYDASTEYDLPYEKTQHNRRRDSGHRNSLRQSLDAEGDGQLLDDQSDGSTEGVRGQGSRDSQSSGINASILMRKFERINAEGVSAEAKKTKAAIKAMDTVVNQTLTAHQTCVLSYHHRMERDSEIHFP